MLYYLLKGLLRPALRIFYAHAPTAAAEPVPETGPLVVIANHPNTLMDPLLVGMLWRRQLHFLTSSRFFRSVGGWVLRAAGAIPLYRQEDHAPPPDTLRAAPAGRLTGSQRAARNETSFRATFGLLASGGALLIFPEGSSVLTRRLRPFKSGAARIALGAEARHAWQLGVRLVPVGLTYAAADRFGSRLARRVGPPIRAADYRARYEANPSGAIRTLTDDLRRALDQQLLAPHSAADEALLRALEALFGPAEFARIAALRRAVPRLEAVAPARGYGLRRRLEAYERVQRRLRLLPGGALTAPPTARLRAGLAAVLGAPAWAWGALNHYPAGRLAAYLAGRLTREAEFTASLTMGLGMLLLPLCYAAQTALLGRLTHSGPLAAAYLLTLPLAGGAARAYQRRWAGWRHAARVWALARRRPQLLATLRAEHAALRADLTPLLTAAAP